jgi:hypothetical protein
MAEFFAYAVDKRERQEHLVNHLGNVFLGRVASNNALLVSPAGRCLFPGPGPGPERAPATGGRSPCAPR